MAINADKDEMRQISAAPNRGRVAPRVVISGRPFGRTRTGPGPGARRTGAHLVYDTHELATGVPYRERGWTWSSVSSPEFSTMPQYWQVLRSRSRMFLRDNARVW